MANNDNDKDKDFIELLELLKKDANRKMIKEMVFHPENIAQVLEVLQKESSSLLPSTKYFLETMKSKIGGHPIAFCWEGTKSLCGKGTLACIGGTKPP